MKTRGKCKQCGSVLEIEIKEHPQTLACAKCGAAMKVPSLDKIKSKNPATPAQPAAPTPTEPAAPSSGTSGFPVETEMPAINVGVESQEPAAAAPFSIQATDHLSERIQSTGGKAGGKRSSVRKAAKSSTGKKSKRNLNSLMAILGGIAGTAIAVGLVVTFLRPKVARVIFSMPADSVSDARLLIDNVSSELPTDGIITIPPGRHEFILQRRGFEPWSAAWTANAGEEKDYKVKWKPMQTIVESDVAAVAAASQKRGEWIQSFEDAQSVAKESGRDILVFFDGSDWCSECREMTVNVFATEAFEKISEEYVLVHIDSPRQSTAREKVESAERNQKLVREFRIAEFPTVWIADAEGTPIVPIGYEPNTESFVAQLGKVRDFRVKRDEFFDLVDDRLRDGQIPEKMIQNSPYQEQISEAVLDRWEKTSLEVDPDDEKGVRGFTFFLAWTYDSIRSRVRDEDRLKRLAKELRDWREEISPKDANRFAKMCFLSALQLSMHDRDQAMQMARFGLDCKPTDGNIAAALRQYTRLDILSTGSGFLIGSEGLMLTNHHVVEDNETVVVRFDGIQEELTADVLAVDEAVDLALLKVVLPSGAARKGLQFDTKSPRLGSEYVALGYPLDAEVLNANDGQFSQVTGEGLVLDGTIQPGNSGGPVISNSGDVVGVVRSKTLQSATRESVGNAIPIAAVARFLATNLEKSAMTTLRGTGSTPANESRADLIERVGPAVGHIIIKAPSLTRQQATKLNEKAWEIAARPDASQSEYAEALEAAEEMCEAYGKDASLLNTLGVVQYRNGMYEEAIQTLTKSSETFAEIRGYGAASDYAFIALSYHELGNSLKARANAEQMEKVLRRPSEANEDNQKFAEEVRKAIPSR